MTERDTGITAATESFSDPALKLAVRQAWGRDHCSGELRERVCCLCGASGRWRIGRVTAWVTAAAALIALAVGIPLVRRSTLRSTSLASTFAAPPKSVALADPASPTSTPSLIPIELQTNLVNTHEHCIHRADHHGLDRDNQSDVAVADAMRARLSHAVLVARPADPGWVFRGAAICHVGSTPCGHLVFARGDQAISIFSLPTSIAPALREGLATTATADGHPIVAFARDGALFCLVGSGPAGSITTDDLNQMRQRMEPDVTADAPDHSAALAELLTPAGP